MDFIPPTSTPRLLKALRSAACYAELAELSGSWEPNEMERRIFGRDYSGKDYKKRRGTFYSAMEGAAIQPRHIDEVERTYPQTKLRWWRQHPLGEILCNASLEQDGVLRTLRSLPESEEREFMWDEKGVGMLSFERFRIEVADSEEAISALVKIGSVESLLVLVARMRLAQLRGRETSLDFAYERAIWQILPTCLAKSPHLYLGNEALLLALDGFLSWSPFSDARFVRRLVDSSIEELRCSLPSRLACELARLSVQPPPEEHLSIRRLLVSRIIAIDA